MGGNRAEDTATQEEGWFQKDDSGPGLAISGPTAIPGSPDLLLHIASALPPGLPPTAAERGKPVLCTHHVSCALPPSSCPRCTSG